MIDIYMLYIYIGKQMILSHGSENLKPSRAQSKDMTGCTIEITRRSRNNNLGFDY